MRHGSGNRCGPGTPKQASERAHPCFRTRASVERACQGRRADSAGRESARRSCSGRLPRRLVASSDDISHAHRVRPSYLWRRGSHGRKSPRGIATRAFRHHASACSVRHGRLDMPARLHFGVNASSGSTRFSSRFEEQLLLRPTGAESLSHSLHHHRNPLTDADAHRHETIPCVAPVQRVHHRRQQA